MTKLWSFLGQKRNREVLSWVGGGAVVVAAGFWAIMTYLYPPSSGSAPKSSANIEANCGSVAVGGNVTGSTVTAQNTSADCSRKK